MTIPFYPDYIPYWTKIQELVRNSGCVFISTHVNPDGDAIGSVMALANFFSRTGVRCRVVLESIVPESYRFLDPLGRIESFPGGNPSDNAPEKNDLVLLLDLGRLDRTGVIERFLTRNNPRLAIIDHHKPESVSADIAAVNPDAESTGSLVYDFILHMDETKINVDIANAILTAMVTDTGYFRYSNTSETTHAVASSLYHHGARVGTIRKRLESGQPFRRQKLLGFTLSNMKRSECGRIVYSVITRRMFDESGALREHTEGIIDQIRIVQESLVAALVIEDADRAFKVSFRTCGNISANEIAAILGGGGHLRASGASMTGTLDEVTGRMLAAVATVIESAKETVRG